MRDMKFVKVKLISAILTIALLLGGTFTAAATNPTAAAETILMATSDTNQSYYAETGKGWNESSLSGYNGEKSRYTYTAGDYVTWTFAPEKAGRYQISWWMVSNKGELDGTKTEITITVGETQSSQWTEEWYSTSPVTPDDWHELGDPVDVAAGETIQVKLATVNGGTLRTSALKLQDVSEPEGDTAAPVFTNPEVQVTSRSDKSLSLRWTAAADGVTAPEKLCYEVYASTEPLKDSVEEETPNATVIGETTATITNLTADTDYYLAVAAKDEAGNTAVWFSENTVSTTSENTSTGQLVLTADVGVKYVLSILTEGSIASAGDTFVGTLFAKELLLEENGKVTVSAGGADVLTRTGGEESIAYALKSAEHDADSTSAQAFAPIVFDRNSAMGEAGGKDLYVSIEEAAWSSVPAGLYQDTVTFTAAYAVSDSGN